ncbi:MAG TPA: hypothetical protein ENK08_09320 [Chloroflexi bacterium]|nr:hypothetical protein [Chloroflexota bacterium]
MYQLSLRTGFVLGVVILLVVPLVTAFAAGGTVVRLEPDVLTLQPGETAEVTIRIEGVTDLAGAEVHLEYDADLLEVVDADPETEGVQIAHGGFLPADFVAQNQVDLDAGRIDYAVARMPPHEPASGNGPLASITLRARGQGEGTLVLQDVLLADPNGAPIPAEVAAGRVAIVVESAPLHSCNPAGALLLGALGMGLVAWPRKRVF